MGGEETGSGALDLVVALCRALEDEGIRYCHWKSNEAIERSASGENDLDLLIDRSDTDRFGAVLHELGFKQARPAPSREVPGLIDHYGLDAGSGRLVHLQAHYQLVLGDDMTKNFHLPVERAYLDSKGASELIRVPAPEFELAVFVVRMILKHSTWDAQLCLMGGLSASEQRELTHLLAQVPEPGRATALAERLPFLSPQLVDRCLRSLESPPSRWQRASIARSLERDLAAYARQARSVDIAQRTVRRGLRGRATSPDPQPGSVSSTAARSSRSSALKQPWRPSSPGWWAGWRRPWRSSNSASGGRRRGSRQRERTVEPFDSPPTGGSRSAISSRRTAPLLTSSSSSNRMRTAGRSTTGCATPVSTSGRGCSSRRGGTTEPTISVARASREVVDAGLHHEATGR